VGRLRIARKPLKPRFPTKQAWLGALAVVVSLFLGTIDSTGGIRSAEAKPITAVLSGGNLGSPIAISPGLLDEAMAAHQGLFRPATDADAYTSATLYGISYTLEMKSVGSPNVGAYFPGRGTTPGLWAASFKEDYLYVATPEWDRVLKLHVVAALTGEDVAAVAAAADSEANGVPRFDQLMADLDVPLVSWDQAARLLPATPPTLPQDAATGSGSESDGGDGFASRSWLALPVALVGAAAIWVAVRNRKRWVRGISPH
jgi:hypothetical protein